MTSSIDEPTVKDMERLVLLRNKAVMEMYLSGERVVPQELAKGAGEGFAAYAEAEKTNASDAERMRILRNLYLLMGRYLDPTHRN